MALRIITLLLLAFVAPLSAQTVRGRVTDRATQQPVVGAFVVLLDATGDGVRADISGPGGEFQHNAPGPGQYRVRVDRIGVQSVTSAPFQIGAGETVPFAMQVETRTVMLPPIVAETESRCTVRPSGGVPLERVWDEARKALSLAAWTEEQGGLPFTAMTYERTRELVSLKIAQEDRRMSSGYDRKTFFSAPARELAARGYVRDGGDGYHRYFGVDAPTLLSDEFLDTHCFRIAAAPRGRPELAGLIGLQFEPVPGHRLPDVQGTLWLDRATSELRHLEFQYTRHLQPWPVPQERFGGRVEFARLGNGAWIVERWWIRMPQFAPGVPSTVRIAGRTIRPEDLRTLGERDLAMAAAGIGLTVREAGGDVVLVHDVHRIGPATAGTAALDGVVVDSARGTPLPGALVYVVGTHHSVRTDAAGRFRLRGLPDGPQRVSFFHPRTDSLMLVVPLRQVALAPGATTEVTLAVPRGGQCSGPPGARSKAALAGHVRNADADTVIADAIVAATFVNGSAREAFEGADPLATHSDSAGRYLLCGLPLGVELVIEAAALTMPPRALRRTFPAEGLYYHEFLVSANR